MSAAIDSQASLRKALLLDSVATGAMGVLLFAAAGLLEGLLGLPVGLMRGAGLVLIPFAAVLAWCALRPRIPQGATMALIVCNALWAVDSLLLPVTGWVQATALGTAFVVAQGLVVAVFAGLEYAGLRRSSGRAVVA